MTTAAGAAPAAGPPAIWQRATRVHVGQGAIVEALAAERPGRALLVVDARQPRLPDVIGRSTRATHTELVSVDPADCDLETSVRLSERLVDADWVVAAGGGSVMDAVALARLFTAAPDTVARIRLGGGRPGLVRGPAPSELGPHPRLIAVPTTVGTAAEVSAAATVLVGGHRKLVMHPQLAADVACLDPAATRTLPPSALREGALEAILRLCNGYLPRPGQRFPPTADAEARDLLRDLAHTTVSGGSALDVAVLSARTVLGFATVGRDSFAGKVWYLANELSTVAGVRKMSATAALVPVVWSRVMRGDTRFGDAERLRAAWAALRAGHPELPLDPVQGLRHLSRAWGVGGPLPPVDPEALAVRAVRAWGAGLPMLDGFSTHDIAGLYADALQGAHQ
ncbi:iron-containing alcohol dehydrogenase [Streptomyces flavofungini]|uniref:iron-containing alcohol dehydrogenase n=1 Tax=Streptomyces flavofungini TaxID=68200 RepID=UPI0025B1AC7C|nr:iron-containing alcohol dehydrogenase [Streptomyces flavofungini]WJV47450.1 iron-containing alcohol dehydrogenase [Streptomyces flavofungini]